MIPLPFPHKHYLRFMHNKASHYGGLRTEFERRKAVRRPERDEAETRAANHAYNLAQNAARPTANRRNWLLLRNLHSLWTAGEQVREEIARAGGHALRLVVDTEPVHGLGIRHDWGSHGDAYEFVKVVFIQDPDRLGESNCSLRELESLNPQPRCGNFWVAPFPIFVLQHHRVVIGGTSCSKEPFLQIVFLFRDTRIWAPGGYEQN
jgi:hypothetical protein